MSKTMGRKPRNGIPTTARVNARLNHEETDALNYLRNAMKGSNGTLAPVSTIVRTLITEAARVKRGGVTPE